MNEPRLFDPSRTSPQPCQVPGCAAIRFPGQTVVLTCNVDHERAIGNTTRRPAACLNAVDPETADWPQGF